VFAAYVGTPPAPRGPPSASRSATPAPGSTERIRPGAPWPAWRWACALR
jgi:hypothetical protein